MADPESPGGEASISRKGLEVIIRRAVELSLTEQDAGDNVSEAELIKIAEELGLSPRHVRQAMYERPPTEEVAEPTFLDRYFGTPTVVASRSVPVDVPIAHGRLEDYLVTREYLQIRRRHGANAYFEPADDAFSSIARAFSRPSGRYHIARAQRAYLTVRPLEPGWSHIRLEMNYAEQRKGQVIIASVLGPLLGGITGALVAGGALVTIGNNPFGVSVAVVGGLASAGGVFTAFWAGMRSSFRKWLIKSRDEADAVLDRLEHGDDLSPPASPWLRRLQQRLRGFGSRPASG